MKRPTYALIHARMHACTHHIQLKRELNEKMWREREREKGEMGKRDVLHMQLIFAYMGFHYYSLCFIAHKPVYEHWQQQ